MSIFETFSRKYLNGSHCTNFARCLDTQYNDTMRSDAQHQHSETQKQNMPPNQGIATVSISKTTLSMTNLTGNTWLYITLCVVVKPIMLRVLKQDVVMLGVAVKCTMLSVIFLGVVMLIVEARLFKGIDIYLFQLFLFKICQKQ